MRLSVTSIPDIILKLQNAATADRGLDVEIALASGYTRSLQSGSSAKRPRYTWFHPKGGVTKVPFFTKHIDAATDLVLLLRPGCSGGFTWGKTFPTAKIEDGPRFAAATPSLALCAAALSAIYQTPEINS